MKGLYKYIATGLISLAMLSACAVDGRRYLQGELSVDSAALNVKAQTSRPLPIVTHHPDGSWTVEPSSKLEELDLILKILTLL